VLYQLHEGGRIGQYFVEWLFEEREMEGTVEE
jgi:hypothetical protein